MRYDLLLTHINNRRAKMIKDIAISLLVVAVFVVASTIYEVWL